MKTRINLYHKEFHPTFEWISFHHMCALVVISLVISAAAYAGLYAWKDSVEQTTLAQSQAAEKEQALIETLTSGLQSRVDNPQLLSQLENVQFQLAAQRALLSRVQSIGELRQKSFSALFDALANANSDKVWISAFRLDELNINIEGSISEPSALTTWITQLSDTAFFRGLEFDDARLIRKDGLLTFELVSREETPALLVSQGGSNESD